MSIKGLFFSVTQLFGQERAPEIDQGHAGEILVPICPIVKHAREHTPKHQSVHPLDVP